jgi:hypothetical protein
MFDLIGPGESLIFVQTPAGMRPLSEMRAPGQAVVSAGKDARSEWVDLTYVHEGAEWRQRHHVVSLASMNFVITAQARAQAMETAVAAQRELVAAITVAPALKA